MFHFLKDARQIRDKYNYLIGETLKPEETPLLKILLVQKTREMEKKWSSQPKSFEPEFKDGAISDDEFEKQIKELEELESTYPDNEQVYIMCVFRTIDGVPRFHPLEWVKTYNGL